MCKLAIIPICKSSVTGVPAKPLYLKYTGYIYNTYCNPLVYGVISFLTLSSDVTNQFVPVVLIASPTTCNASVGELVLIPSLLLV